MSNECILVHRKSGPARISVHEVEGEGGRYDHKDSNDDVLGVSTSNTLDWVKGVNIESID